MSTYLDYPNFVALRFKRTLVLEYGPLVHAAIGIAGEAGEFIDAVKKAAVYGQALNCQNLVEELGDLEFYMEAARQQLGVTREMVIQCNIDKLEKRYPTGYTDEHAALRLDKQETECQIKSES